MNNFAAFSDQTSESMFALARLLESGQPMVDALQNIGGSSRNLRLRDASLLASDQLNRGESPENVFRNSAMFVFPPFARYFLSCPVSDEIKGRLMSGWISGQVVFTISPVNLLYPFQTLAIGLLSSTSMVMFVLPQFKEIMLGMRIEAPPVLKFLFWFEFSMFSPMFFLVLLLIAAFVGSFFLLVQKVLAIRTITDQIALLSILAAVEKVDRPRVLSLLGSKVLFPVENERIKKLAGALSQGKTPTQACDLAEVPMGLRWFLVMGLESENSGEMLGHGQHLLQNIWAARTELALALLEVTVMIILGIIFGTMIYGVFAGMSAVLQGAM